MRIDRWVGLMLVLACLGSGGCDKQGPRVVPLSTSSDEALQLFFKGRAAMDALRTAEAHSYFDQAVAKDPDFAMAHLGLAESSPTAQESVDHLRRAMLRAKTITEGERLLIRAVHAARTHNLSAEFEYSSQAARRYPDDERAQLRLGDFYLKRDNATLAVRSYKKALELAPDFAVAHRHLATAYQATERFEQAEESAKSYLDAYPKQAGAHDLYAGLLMKTGRFEESIAAYEKALELDPGDTNARIGIGNNLLFMGRGEQARQALNKLLEQARDEATKITARKWIAAAYIHEERTDAALAELSQALETIDSSVVPLEAAELLDLMGNILLESGDPDGALAHFTKSLSLVESAKIAQHTKDIARAGHTYYEARVALSKQDPETARDKMTAYRRSVGDKWVEGAAERFNELNGLIEFADGSPQPAVRRLLLAGRKNPRVMFLTATAYRQYDEAKSQVVCEKIVNFNEPNFELAYVRAKAQRLLAGL